MASRLDWQVMPATIGHTCRITILRIPPGIRKKNRMGMGKVKKKSNPIRIKIECISQGLIMTIKIHSTAEISPQAQIGENTSIWHQSQVREGANIGKNCILGKGVYIDAGVCIGDQVKIQNYVSIFH